MSLSSPSDDANGVVLQPTLSWSSSARSTEYDVQVSTDGFSSYVVIATTMDTSYSIGSALSMVPPIVGGEGSNTTEMRLEYGKGFYYEDCDRLR